MSCNEDTLIKGPYSQLEWQTMLRLKHMLAYMKKEPVKFRGLIEEDEERNKKYLSRVLS